MTKKDDTIIKIDTFLLGWIFKHGQLSIYLDNNDYIGPHTTIGKLINNILQVFYLFYYIIPYTTLYAICEANCIKEIVYRYINNGQKSYSYNRHWKNAFFMFGVYNITYILVFLINTLVPAGSPRIFLKNEYKHTLNLSGFPKFLNNICKDDKSANSFPSGHVAETICFAFAFFGVGKKLEGFIFLFCSIMIIFATLFLRYHYFSDVLIALLIAGFGFNFNYYYGYIREEYTINKKKEKNVIYMINENGEIINNV
jgi:membrane-associated phospholipid phosphatase